MYDQLGGGFHRYSVDERWLVKYRRWIYAGGYGVQIGTGFATYVMTAGVYLLLVLAGLTARPVEAFGALIHTLERRGRGQ